MSLGCIIETTRHSRTLMKTCIYVPMVHCIIGNLWCHNVPTYWILFAFHYLNRLKKNTSWQFNCHKIWRPIHNELNIFPHWCHFRCLEIFLDYSNLKYLLAMDNVFVCGLKWLWCKDILFHLKENNCRASLIVLILLI